jgi:hypothetical protein
MLPAMRPGTCVARRAAAIALLAVLLSTLACEQAVPGTRTLRFVGAPSCAQGAPYERPIVVRLDRERSLFDEPWSAQLVLTGPTDPSQLELPRRRLRLTMRVGVCAPTSLATWDCAAPAWASSLPLDVDTRATPIEVKLPKVPVACVPGGRAR